MALAMSTVRSRPGSTNGRINMLLVCLFHAFAPAVKAIPLPFTTFLHALDEDLPKSPDDASLWVYLGVALVLVLGGGVFAGLTIAYADYPRSIILC